GIPILIFVLNMTNKVFMNEVSVKLTAIFHNVNDWLKFAEAKNAILLGFSGTGVSLTISLITTDKNIPNSLRIGLLIANSLFCICTLFCAFSFMPKINLERLLWVIAKPSKNSQVQLPDTDNFYYFGHLQKYSSTSLLEVLNKLYFDGCLSIPYQREHEDLAIQIVTNAKITFLKFQLFTYALYILIAALLVIPLSTLISLIVYRRL
ncbi:hypothetical protein, partial [Nodularia sphaerocarpa]|uniref:hypothetical protein n=3 Tax=Nodularia sphaerocarpa TaxID=137816 RepID=UPI002FEE12EC